MALRTNDIDELRSLDFLAHFSSDEKSYPQNTPSLSSSSVPVTTTTTTTSDHPNTMENEHDLNIDKFATLFTPSTPRGSPTLLPIFNPQPSAGAHRRLTTDESRSFISVSADEDPLLSSIAPSNTSLGVPTAFEWDKDDNELITTPVLTPVLSPSASVVSIPSQTCSEPTRCTDNTSLTFFDKFAQDAKRNSEIRRKGLVDELLRCEDNPLYFLQNGKGDEEEDRRRTPDNDEHEQPTEQKSQQSSPPPIDTVLQDLDHEYFSSGRMVDLNTHNDNDETSPKRQLSGSSHSRSPSLPYPATLAPPVIDWNHSSDLHDPSDKASTGNDLSVSRSSPSTFSTKWMSNLLKTSSSSGYHHQQLGHGATPALESIFGGNGNTDTPSSSHPPSGTTPPKLTSTVSSIYRRNSSSPIHFHSTGSHPQPQTSHTLPTPSTILPYSGGIIKHAGSPFGAHSYVPPSGAPGFRGELYDWDKGFSNELAREIGRGRASGRDKGRVEFESKMQSHIRADVGVGIGIGALMEKKSGNLDLKGRRATTTPVLSQSLAVLLRPHLPALCRLPRSWTLIYSLDQHGISLNTLYTRCEETLSPSRVLYPSRADEVGLGTRGVLLIIKDAGAAGEEDDEGAFGAWLADGEGLGIGKKGGKGYFGGGESFLWKFTQGMLKVYKTTGRNNYVALCEPGYISFGGGDGHYGLYLDDTLYDGSSAPCPTFDNEPLCSPGPKKAGTATVEFECVGLEVWGMGP